MSTYDMKRLELAAIRYIDRNGVPPTLAEIAHNASMTVNVAHRLAEKSKTLRLTWTGPRPAMSKMLVEVSDED
ncbi:MAG TPA: hypothetical protein VGE09_11110 [Pseudoxanthomonas sp.]